jgi:hypothetical protein
VKVVVVPVPGSTVRKVVAEALPAKAQITAKVANFNIVNSKEDQIKPTA